MSIESKNGLPLENYYSDSFIKRFEVGYTRLLTAKDEFDPKSAEVNEEILNLLIDTIAFWEDENFLWSEKTFIIEPGLGKPAYCCRIFNPTTLELVENRSGIIDAASGQVLIHIIAHGENKNHYAILISNDSLVVPNVKLPEKDSIVEFPFNL